MMRNAPTPQERLVVYRRKTIQPYTEALLGFFLFLYCDENRQHTHPESPKENKNTSEGGILTP